MEKEKYETTQVEVSFGDLVAIISGLYFGGDEDLSQTEDLIDYLNEHSDMSAVVTQTKRVD